MAIRAHRTARAYLLSGLIVGAIPALAVLVRLLPGPFPIDDAYITFRYARNVAQGHGLVYNPGERVLGTTTPLFAFVLAGAAVALGTDHIPTYPLVVNALADGASVRIFFWMLGRLGVGRTLRTVGGLMLALSPLGIRYAVGGMESSLATLSALAITASTLLGRRRSASLIGSLAYLIRPDLLAATASAGLADFWDERRVPRRLLLTTSGVVLGAAVLMTWTYGTPCLTQSWPRWHRSIRPAHG